jgi:hypothetical protein
MPTDAEILSRKQAREIAAELADLIVGETKAMSAETKAIFDETLGRLLRLPLSPGSASSAEPPGTIVPFSDAHARAWGRNKMQFGKYEGQRIDEVPLSYLEKLAEPNDFTRHLRRYLASARIAMEQEAAEQNPRSEGESW